MPETPGDAASGTAPSLDPTLRSLIESSPLAMLALDRSGRLLATNAAAARLLGLAPDVALGVLLAGVPADLVAHLAGDERAAGVHRAEGGWLTQDGRRITVSAISSPLFDAAGAVAGAVVQLVEVGDSGGVERLAMELQRLSIVLFRPITRDEVAHVVAREACVLVGAVAAHLRAEGLAGSDAATEAATDARGVDVAAHRPEIGQAPGLEQPSESAVVVPVVVDGRRIGELELSFDGQAVLDDHARLALSTLGALTGQALQRAGMYEEADRVRHEAVRAGEQAASLVALTADLSAALTPEAVARAAMERGLPAVGATSGSLVLLDPTAGDLVIVAMHGYPEEVSRSVQRIAIGADFPLAEAVRTRKAVFLESPAVWSERYPLLEDALRGSDVQALATIPLEVHGRVIGGLRLGFPTVRSFDAADAAYIHALADKCAQAIERSRLFEAERNARLTLDTVLNQMPIGVVVAEPPDGRIVLANAQVDRIWRAPAREAHEAADYGSRVGYGADGSRLASDEWPLARSLADGETVDGEEIEIERADGSRGTVMVSSAPVRDAAGTIVAAVATIADITDRREADLMREAFLGILSHELRTPITAIYGGIQLLRRPPERVDDATRREVVEDVAAEAERLNRLVEDLLVLARAERGVSLSAADPVLLTHLLRRVIAIERTRWPATRFSVRMPSRVPAVRGDESYVEQILRNLLSNAAKYGPADGQVDVAVTVGEDEVVVRVVDEGPGIDETEAGNLFRLFYRSPRTATAPGAGIGLFVARSLVEAMGGRIWAIPRTDRRGAEFGIGLRLFEDVDEI